MGRPCKSKGVAALAAILCACLCMAGGETAVGDVKALPSWASEADPEVFQRWVENFADGRDFSAVRAVYSEQFLMNVPPDVKVLMNIDSIQVEDEGSIIVVSATTNGVPMSLGVEVSDEDTGKQRSVSALNGYLNVTVGDTLWDMKPIAVTDDFVKYVDGKARVAIPSKFGKFIKATVDYKASAEGKLSD